MKAREVKLIQVASTGIDRSEISYKLTFPVQSSGARLFLEFLEMKKEHFKGNPSFLLNALISDSNCLEKDLFSIQLFWLNETANECFKYIKDNII